MTDILVQAREQVLERGVGLDQDQTLQVLQLPDDQLDALLELAHEVRMKWCGPDVEVEGIISLKTGGCPEDCHFCSQSGLFASPVRSAWLDIPSLVEAAKQTAKTGATEFCIVAAVRGPDERLLSQVAAGIEAIRNEVDIQIACSLGMLTEEQVQRLADMGVHRYNHNLETARSFFTNVVTTHTWEERWDTLRMVREAGMEVCCGGILGMGETLEQRAEFAANLSELGRSGVPARAAAHHAAVRRWPRDHPRRPGRQAGHSGRYQRRHRRQLPHHAGPSGRGGPGAARRSADADQGSERDAVAHPVRLKCDD
ncbi:MAG: biotin synthase [Mycobacterium sp.]|nr:biotin synthase [Mycobacterium sp.]